MNIDKFEFKIATCDVCGKRIENPSLLFVYFPKGKGKGKRAIIGHNKCLNGSNLGNKTASVDKSKT